MALFSFSAQVCQRKHGRSSVSMAAYRAGEALYEERTRETHDYSRKRVEHSEILAPAEAPEWVYHRATLWNVQEALGDLSTRPKQAVTARELRIALPRELNREQQIELMREFLREEFVSRGMVADWSLHEEPGKNQPHAHVMLTTRELDREHGFGKKVPAWDRKSLLYHWREQWAVHANRALERAGHEERIDHRSYADRDIDLAPQPKLYRHVDEAATDTRDNVQERLEKYLRVARENGERILADPTIALRVLTEQRATFRREDLLKFLNTHTVDAAQFEACLNAVMASDELVEVGTDEHGVERFTSEEMRAAEQGMLSDSDALAEGEEHRVETELVEQALARADERLQATAKPGAEVPRLSAEQREAITYVTRDTGDLALMEGRAGTGKSTALDAVRDASEAQGLTVVGAALAGKAAEGLERSSGIKARTLASWERAWERGKDLLTSNHVLVIDEAGMLGTRQLGRVLKHARRAGAKVVLVGDTQQLQAIEAGSPFRALIERHGAKTLSKVQRQRIAWQQKAAELFGRKEALEALGAYHEHEAVHAHLTTQEARESVVKAWAADKERAPVKERLMLAYRRDDVRELNGLAREVRRRDGELGKDHVFKTANGERAFAVGDRVLFGQNDSAVGVKNGTLGTVEKIRGDVMLLQVDGGKQVFVDLRTYDQVDHGYAVTLYKSQGVTVDRSYVLASKLMDGYATNVALTRQREHAELHWAREEFGTIDRLDATLSRQRPKELSFEFEERPELAARTLLAQAIQDDSRFALLAPDEQRALVQELASDIRAREPRAAAPERLFEKLPEILNAQARVQKTREHYQALRKQLEELEAKRSTVMGKLSIPAREVEELRARIERANKEYTSASVNERLLRENGSLLARARERALELNAPLRRKQDKLERWRGELAAVERAGLLEHELERMRKNGHTIARFANRKDCGARFDVAGTKKVGTVRATGEELYCTVLRDELGNRVLVESSRFEVDKGERVQLLDVGDGGALKLEMKVERGHGRGGWSR